MILLEATNLSKTFGEGPNAVQVLRGVNLTVAAGEMTAVIGASGSGKTTLLQLLGTLARPTAGDLYYRGKNLSTFTAKQLAAFRNQTIGFIFQFHHLLPDFTALENVMMPALIGGCNKKTVRLKAEDLLNQVDLSHRFHHKVGQLSGGEQQRAALARALVMEPELLLADEPTGNLDSRAGENVFLLLKTLSRRHRLATVMVTHNLDLAEEMDHILTLQDGILTPHLS
jgi:lipoprotein-releasing system ATP-binding protein